MESGKSGSRFTQCGEELDETLPFSPIRGERTFESCVRALLRRIVRIYQTAVSPCLGPGSNQAVRTTPLRHSSGTICPKRLS